jgi:hypothetical protein
MAKGRYEGEGCGATALCAGQFDFGTWLQEQARNTPWWILSVAAHAVLIMVFMALTFSSETAISGMMSEVSYVVSDAPVVKDEPPPDTDAEMTPEDPQEFVERPLDTEFNRETQSETNDNSEFNEMRTEASEIDSKSPLKGQGWSDSLGVGPGAGGFSCRGRGGKTNRLAERGGNVVTENSVWAGLRWLARHQTAAGARAPSRTSARTPSAKDRAPRNSTRA